MESNSSQIEIMKMQEHDLALFQTTLQNDFDDFWSFNILKQEFYNENTTYIVAKIDDEIVGFAGFMAIMDEANIMNIVTKKNKRQLGIGTLLLTNLINIARAKKLTSITLEVNEKNTAAINLYKKLNFEQVGLRKKYYNNTDSAILMTLYL